LGKFYKAGDGVEYVRCVVVEAGNGSFTFDDGERYVTLMGDGEVPVVGSSLWFYMRPDGELGFRDDDPEPN
jgi:hypothetical protein